LLRTILALIALLAASDAAYAENRVLKCHVGSARHAPLPDGPALTANVAKSMTPIPLDAAQFTDKKLAKSMVVEGLFSRITDSGSSEVTARFVNCTKNTLAIRVRTSFMDAQQFPTEPSSAWRTVFIPALGTGLYSEKSIAPKGVANFLIELAPN